MLRTYLMLGGIAVVLASGVAVKVIDADRDKWRAAAGDYRAASVRWKANAEGWHASFDKAELLRGQEFNTAKQATRQARQACAAELSNERSAASAAARLLSRPVKTDAKGCAIRELWTAAMLKPVLRPGAR